MESKLTVFRSELFGEIRTTTDSTGNPIFNLSDASKSLGIVNSRNAVKRLQQKGVHTVDTLTSGGVQKLTFINEPNLYRLIFQSRKAEAEQFQDWIFEEVLPSIRKNGGYIVGQESSDPEAFRKAVIERSNCIVESVTKELTFWKRVVAGQQQRISQLEALL